MLRRPLTLTEAVDLVRLACRIRDEIDLEAGEALLKVAGGDDDALAIFHDRLNVLGRFGDTDWLRRIVS